MSNNNTLKIVKAFMKLVSFFSPKTEIVLFYKPYPGSGWITRKANWTGEYEPMIPEKKITRRKSNGNRS